MKASKKRFRIGAQSNPVEFMSWLLNTLHADLRSAKKNTSIIDECLQGELEVVKEIPKNAMTEKKEIGDDQNGGREHGKTSKMPFLMLGLDLPPPPLFKDVMEKNIIPQVPLFNILKKFDGETVTGVVRPHVARMRYRVTRVPQYIILHMRRFTNNNLFVEKNPTLGKFYILGNVWVLICAQYAQGSHAIRSHAMQVIPCNEQEVEKWKDLVKRDLVSSVSC
ncbi:hypothetical protein Dsin_012866 [Dipteronia sinensis]|uniref:Peptidase C19 ubiquitin carboxyl-terminal hydrolase domain-containing protein n=1 Tax=Dipteronia sinensis TaxID=43782 RepID=A0AAE0AJ28_9ROSI|nr:hypothetical protein Dsin_012866 [Dipteronia sinensis]